MLVLAQGMTAEVAVRIELLVRGKTASAMSDLSLKEATNERQGCIGKFQGGERKTRF